MTLAVTDRPGEGARARIAGALGEYNASRTGGGEWRTLAVLILDADGETIGGLWGVTAYGWLAMELLFVPEGMRGQGLGGKMIRMAEAEARARGCARAWLDTFAFQAPEFYKRLGYVVFGELPDYPPGGTRYFLRKDLLAEGRP